MEHKWRIRADKAREQSSCYTHVSRFHKRPRREYRSFCEKSSMWKYFHHLYDGYIQRKKKKEKDIVISEKNVLQKFTFPTDDGTLWGCGCNKYGQLGQSPEKLSSSSKFVKLDVPLRSESIKDFRCYEWGTVLVTD